MTLEDLLKRADELIQLGNQVLTTGKTTKYSAGEFVDTGLFAEFRVAALSFLLQMFGANSPYHKSFDADVKSLYSSEVKKAIGILKACRNELAGGWVFTTRALV